ncbi:aspartate/glutamate racemase family protein [Microbulbifer halophilus]|uniref:Aspartate/glutamate racemase family protein n=1 Tax=Microbulbifer halophilus TaxID=453963 RepID=A0ABW5E9Z6_9GAMM|nr:aspartate/glutamate racemase family protein [Microbulbifer halophilus]MCW8126092.1 aspartate/glutamate racemase family protein [Microbulbifer halophilus]
MKTIGLLGGMSWESTQVYYRLINETVREKLGGLHSARLLLNSIDFADIEPLQRNGQWRQAGELLAAAAESLAAGGADFLVLCTNTMHKVAPTIEAAVPLPLLHIADATAAVIEQAGIRRVGLLGTAFTMEQDFYRGRLLEKHGIAVDVPGEIDRALVHRVIFEELCRGTVTEASRREFRDIVARLQDAGAEAVVLGCTEIGLLLRPEDVPIPLFDTAEIHARAAVELALK